MPLHGIGETKKELYALYSSTE